MVFKFKDKYDCIYIYIYKNFWVRNFDRMYIKYLFLFLICIFVWCVFCLICLFGY